MGFDLNEHPDVEKSVDRVAGDYGFDSGVYDCLIDMAYLEETKSGAAALYLTLVCDNKRHRETFYVTSGKSKGQKNFYVDKDGKKHFLQGFATANSLCKVAAGVNLAEVSKKAQKKTIDLYDWQQRKEIATEKDFVLTELIGKPVKVCMVKSVENRRKNDGSGKYVDTNEKRTVNYVSAFVNAETGLTASEIEAGTTEPDFLPKWKAANDGVTRDNFTAVEEASSSASGNQQQKLFS